jgi:UDP-N-acetylglucosamine--N-acetylmuramyl-(pentapeptide) pyrophosphoryl-undecaprenol N-acetylglucosamine transferase
MSAFSQPASLQPPRILIVGGGTGGHIIPALAVARELVARAQAKILFVGTSRGLESRLVPDAGFPLQLVAAVPLNQVSLATRLRTASQLPVALLDCIRILRSFRAHAVLGVGGYASGPGMAAALLLRVPTLAFEPNAVPGLTNRLVGRFVSAAAVNFPPAARWFRQSQVTGIPVRPEFFSIAPVDPRQPLHLLVFGGSQGARILNTLLPPVIPDLLQAFPTLTVLHQAGARHAESTRADYSAACSGFATDRWRVEPFLDNMAACFARAHLVLARSGASTVAELAASGRPALLVPFAAAADNHQQRNAEVMQQAQSAAMLTEDQLRQQPALLFETLRSLLADPARLAAMGQSARSLAHPRAAAEIADRLLALASRR